jgi:hypothetical protein
MFNGTADADQYPPHLVAPPEEHQTSIIQQHLDQHNTADLKGQQDNDVQHMQGADQEELLPLLALLQQQQHYPFSQQGQMMGHAATSMPTAAEEQIDQGHQWSMQASGWGSAAGQQSKAVPMAWQQGGNDADQGMNESDDESGAVLALIRLGGASTKRSSLHKSSSLSAAPEGDHPAGRQSAKGAPTSGLAIESPHSGAEGGIKPGALMAPLGLQGNQGTAGRDTSGFTDASTAGLGMMPYGMPHSDATAGLDPYHQQLLQYAQLQQVQLQQLRVQLEQVQLQLLTLHANQLAALCGDDKHPCIPKHALPAGQGTYVFEEAHLHQ